MEWRQFNFSLIPESKHLRGFAWKILVIAVGLKIDFYLAFVQEVLMLDYETVIWADTSLNFHYDGFGKFFDLIDKGVISPVQTPSDASHTIRFATHQSALY